MSGEIPEILRCGSFRPGHEVHWIQGLKNGREPGLGAGTATVAGDGWITVTLVDGRVERRWTHDPARLRALLADSGNRVELRGMDVLGVPRDEGVVACVSVAKEATPCPTSASAAGMSIEEQLVERGGFTIAGADAALTLLEQLGQAEDESC